MKNSSGFGLTWFLLFGFWILLSGQLDTMHLAIGFVCSLLVAFFSHDLLITSHEGVLRHLGIFVRGVPYFLWLVLQVIVANIEVARLVIDPKMPLRPGIIKLRSRLRNDVALTTLANSITLTPGTMIVDIIGSDLYTHCLVVEDEEKVLDAEREFERRVERLYGLEEGNGRG